MTKNLKVSFIFNFVMLGVMIAWHTLVSFFSGVGVAFVAILTCFVGMVCLFVCDKLVRARTKDLFIVSCVLMVLELIVFLVCFSKNANVVQHMYDFHIVLSILGLFVFGYFTFRFIVEIKNLNLRIVERMLGNYRGKKARCSANKELDNGSLEAKPNAVSNTTANDSANHLTNEQNTPSENFKNDTPSEM